MKSLRKINTKLQLLYRQNKYLTPGRRRLLYDSLIQPHFDYASFLGLSSFLCFLVSQKMRKKILVNQNKYICFCLELSSREHIGAKEFQEVNWLRTKERVEQHVATNVFKYWKETSLFFLNELLTPHEIHV